MWILAVAIYAGCKALTLRNAANTDAPRWKRLGYLFAWPGMDIRAFIQSGNVQRPGLRDWVFAAIKTVIGSLLLFFVVRALPESYPYLAGWVGMIGMGLTLHFGTFHLLSCAWRRLGVDAPPLMDRPLASTSLSEFWGRRWNRAFRDLTYGFLFRPLIRSFGPRRALLIGFVASGIIHDLVISFPAGGGYGGPTLFFSLHGVALFIERSPFGRRIGMGAGTSGRLYALGLVLLPAPLLFHPPFVIEIIVPFLRAIHAMP